MNLVENHPALKPPSRVKFTNIQISNLTGVHEFWMDENAMASEYTAEERQILANGGFVLRGHDPYLETHCDLEAYETHCDLEAYEAREAMAGWLSRESFGRTKMDEIYDAWSGAIDLATVMTVLLVASGVVYLLIR